MAMIINDRLTLRTELLWFAKLLVHDMCLLCFSVTESNFSSFICQSGFKFDWSTKQIFQIETSVH